MTRSRRESRSLGRRAVADKDPLILDMRRGSVLDSADLDEYYVSGLDDEPTNWDDIDLDEAFDLPPVLPVPLQNSSLEPMTCDLAGCDSGHRRILVHGRGCQAGLQFDACSAGCFAASCDCPAVPQ